MGNHTTGSSGGIGVHILRTAVKNGSDIVAECPISSVCSSLPEEDGGMESKCGHLGGYLKSNKGLKVQCRYQEKRSEI